VYFDLQDKIETNGINEQRVHNKRNQHKTDRLADITELFLEATTITHGDSSDIKAFK
jgi:hypothetical protein